MDAASTHNDGNMELYYENQALRQHNAQLTMQVQTQAQHQAAIINQLQGENHALHVEVGLLKNQINANKWESDQSYRQLLHRSDIEKRDLYSKQAALEAEINQYKSATSIFSGMSVIEAKQCVVKLRQDLAQAVKARQDMANAANKALSTNMVRSKATIKEAKDTIARLTHERNELEATNNALIAIMPVADAKMKETSTRNLLESAILGSSPTTALIMSRGNGENHITSTKDLLASFRPDQPRPAQRSVTVDLTGEYPTPAETPATYNRSATSTGVASSPVGSGFNAYELFPRPSQSSYLMFGGDSLVTCANSVQSSKPPLFDSASPNHTHVAAYVAAPDGGDLLETNGDSQPFTAASTVSNPPPVQVEVAGPIVAPTASDTVEAHIAAAQSPTMVANMDPTVTPTQVTAPTDPPRAVTPFTAWLNAELADTLQGDPDHERREAEAVAEAEATWVPDEWMGYLNGSLEQIKEDYGENVEGYRHWLLSDNARRREQEQESAAGMETEEVKSWEEEQVESESRDIVETIENEG